jgi:hypothetical protein
MRASHPGRGAAQHQDDQTSESAECDWRDRPELHLGRNARHAVPNLAKADPQVVGRGDPGEGQGRDALHQACPGKEPRQHQRGDQRKRDHVVIVVIRADRERDADSQGEQTVTVDAALRGQDERRNPRQRHERMHRHHRTRRHSETVQHGEDRGHPLEREGAAPQCCAGGGGPLLERGPGRRPQHDRGYQANGGGQQCRAADCAPLPLQQRQQPDAETRCGLKIISPAATQRQRSGAAVPPGTSRSAPR